MWYQLNIKDCQRDQVEAMSSLLEDKGALSVTLTDKNDDPVLEPEPGTTPLWPDVIMHALFADKSEADEVHKLLLTTYPLLRFSIDDIPDQDWHRAWMDDFKPQRFGQRLWICPTWHTPPEPKAVNLMLDPGLAFGTGTHPTTALCLTWLEQADLKNKLVIDYGCGSGILALAAAKLGAEKVYAVDIDPQALQATKNNSEVNQISEETLGITAPEKLSLKADLLIANILLRPLLSLKPRFEALLNDQAILVVSGILEEQIDELIQTYQTEFCHQSTQTMEGWALVAFTRL